jgi:hypothetical protein
MPATAFIIDIAHIVFTRIIATALIQAYNDDNLMFQKAEYLEIT